MKQTWLLLLLRTLIFIEAAYAAYLGVLACLFLGVAGLWASVNNTTKPGQLGLIIVLVAALTAAIIPVTIVSALKMTTKAWAFWIIAILNLVIFIGSTSSALLSPTTRDLALYFSMAVSLSILVMLYFSPMRKTFIAMRLTA